MFLVSFEVVFGKGALKRLKKGVEICGFFSKGFEKRMALQAFGHSLLWLRV